MFPFFLSLSSLPVLFMPTSLCTFIVVLLYFTSSPAFFFSHCPQVSSRILAYSVQNDIERVWLSAVCLCSGSLPLSWNRRPTPSHDSGDGAFSAPVILGGKWSLVESGRSRSRCDNFKCGELDKWPSLMMTTSGFLKTGPLQSRSLFLICRIFLFSTPQYDKQDLNWSLPHGKQSSEWAGGNIYHSYVFTASCYLRQQPPVIRASSTCCRRNVTKR